MGGCIYSVVGYLPLGGPLVGVVKLGFEGSFRPFKQVIGEGVELCCSATSCLLARCCRPSPARSVWVASLFAWT